jgi:hypothetical protein
LIAARLSRRLQLLVRVHPKMRRYPARLGQLDHVRGRSTVIVMDIDRTNGGGVRSRFHGGESGSIPLGSANNFNGLAFALPAVSNGCPISLYRLA